MPVPAIGICAVVERVKWGAWEQVVDMVPRTYPSAVQRAGGLATILPPDRAAPDAPDEWLDRIDALLLAGGADIDPATYSAERDPSVGGTWPDRDSFEITLTRRAAERGMPVLGICRGMQLLNVALGGTIEQHLPDRLGNDLHRRTPGEFTGHSVRLEPGSRAAAAVGSTTAEARSHHHQGVDRLGDGLVATGWSEPDGVIEAIEIAGENFVLGVLWHPEEDGESKVIPALVAAANRAAPGREAEEVGAP